MARERRQRLGWQLGRRYKGKRRRSWSGCPPGTACFLNLCWCFQPTHVALMKRPKLAGLFGLEWPSRTSPPEKCSWWRVWEWLIYYGVEGDLRQQNNRQIATSPIANQTCRLGAVYLFEAFQSQTAARKGKGARSRWQNLRTEAMFHNKDPPAWKLSQIQVHLVVICEGAQPLSNSLPAPLRQHFGCLVHCHWDQ